MTLFSEEIKKGMSLDYKYEILDGYKFEKAPVMKKFM